MRLASPRARLAPVAACHTPHDEPQPPLPEGSAPAAPSAVPFAGLSPVAGDFTRKDFTPHSKGGEKLPSLRIHYVTLGTARRDASGHVSNAVPDPCTAPAGRGRGFARRPFADERCSAQGRRSTLKLATS